MNRRAPGVPCITLNPGDTLSGTQPSRYVLAETNPGIKSNAGRVVVTV